MIRDMFGPGNDDPTIRPLLRTVLWFSCNGVVTTELRYVVRMSVHPSLSPVDQALWLLQQAAQSFAPRRI